MKLVENFRGKNKEYLKAKIDELETNSKIKNIRDLCRGISDFKKGYLHRTSMVQNERGECVILFWLCRGTISLSCSMYMALVMLGRQK